MPALRLRPQKHPVTITLDGTPIVADRASSIAAALVAADELVLARSPKFHRPRGPSCHRGGCDGCLMRVDGVPNVMTCMVPAAEGQRVERQNVVLSSRLDVMRAADWFFPDGMNHHELFTGVPGVQKVMLGLARRVSGLGEMPDRDVASVGKRVETRTVDVLVVGGGPAGLLAATAIARAGRSVMIVDESIEAGGSLRAFPHGARLSGVEGPDGPTSRAGERGEIDVDAACAGLLEEATARGVVMLGGATTMGVLEGDDWLVDRAHGGILRIGARAHVIATGGHDATPVFAGNDLPGVFSARAAGRLLRAGVLVGEAPLVVGDGPFARAFAAAMKSESLSVQRASLASVVEAKGLSRVRGATLKKRGRAAEEVRCDAIIVDAPVAPSFEIAVQGGARTRHGEHGYAVEIDKNGAVVLDEQRNETQSIAGRPMFAIGEVTGAELSLPAYARSADRLARALISAMEST